MNVQPAYTADLICLGSVQRLQASLQQRKRGRHARNQWTDAPNGPFDVGHPFLELLRVDKELCPLQ